MGTSVHQIAEGPQYRLHKGSKRSMKAASGFHPSRGPGRGLHRKLKLWRGAHEVNPRSGAEAKLEIDLIAPGRCY